VVVYCFTQLIQPGKREEAIFKQIRGACRSEYEALGIIVDRDVVLCGFPERSGGVQWRFLLSMGALLV
jgi:hypothetical protein